jgi:hypothetical protein
MTRAEGNAEEELLRAELARITPSGSNPRRVQEVRQRVTVARRRRRRRVRIAGAAALTVAVAVTVQVWRSFPATERTVATPRTTWAPPATTLAPPGFTSLPTSALSRKPSRGWQAALRPDRRPGARAVVTFSPTSAAPLTPLVDGGALLFYVQAEPGDPRATVRRVFPVDDWCRRAGGTQELKRVPTPARARAGTVVSNGYACLNNASTTATEQTTEILATAPLDAPTAVGPQPRSR